MTPYLWFLFVLLSTATLFDGFDSAMLSFAAPESRKTVTIENLPFFGFYRNGEFQGGLTTTKEAGFSDFGGDSFREPLEVLTASMQEEAGLSTFGRIATANMIKAQLATRLRLQAWTKTNPAVADEKIERPWIILGLPRTGTSILSQLLGLDPMVRPLLQWEARAVVPPPTLATEHTDPRIAESDATMGRLLELSPAIGAMHPFGAMLAEECIPLMMLDLRCLGMETQALVPSYGAWLQGCDMSPAYVQHKKGLQALQPIAPIRNTTDQTDKNTLSARKRLFEISIDRKRMFERDEVCKP